jgi:hypothetical protein
VRENRTHGSEGGETVSSRPLSVEMVNRAAGRDQWVAINERWHKHNIRASEALNLEAHQRNLRPF